MSVRFDPYHRWLGIPSGEQPAHHYRLLGLAPFEDDIEVIRDAAERQMAHIRRYQLGQHAELSQKILNELAGAKACLIDAKKKTAYDERLRERLTPAKTIAVHPAEPPRGPLAPAAPVAQSREAVPTLVATEEATTESPDASVTEPPAEVDESYPEWPPTPWSGPTTSAPSRRSAETQRQPKRTATIIGWIVAGFLLLLVVVVGLIVLQGCPQQLPVAPKPAAPPPPPKPVLPPQPKVAAPPRLVLIKNQNVDRGAPLKVPVKVQNPGAAANLVFQLAANIPDGAAIAPQTGEFTWTPSKAGTYVITVQLVAAGGRDVFDQSTFRVQVRAPSLRPIPDVSVNPGEERRVQASLMPVDPPFNKLTFALVGNEPKGAEINPESGEFTWTPENRNAGESYPVTVGVTADDNPKWLHDKTTFSIKVNELPKDAPINISLSPGKAITTALLSRIEEERQTFEHQARSRYRKNNGDVYVSWHDRTQKTHGADDLIDGIASYNPQTKKIAGALLLFHKGTKVPKLYVSYRFGSWDKWLASWSENGEKRFWCKYAQNMRDGLCCLFKDDRLVLVADCSKGKIHTVHLIRGNEVSKSFCNLGEAKADATAEPLIAEMDQIEATLRTEGKDFGKLLK